MGKLQKNLNLVHNKSQTDWVRSEKNDISNNDLKHEESIFLPEKWKKMENMIKKIENMIKN